MENIILASGSPRREEFLRILGLPFSSIPSNIDESYETGDEPGKIVEELAKRKVIKTLEIIGYQGEMRQNHEALWICGADTLISLNGEIFGKPHDREDARRMLCAFSGSSHEVISAIALYNVRAKTMDCRSFSSVVTFAPISKQEIEWYLDSGEWQDAAGAYKIQGKASCFISGISGSYSNIVGLPLREFYVMLRDNGYRYGG